MRTSFIPSYQATLHNYDRTFGQVKVLLPSRCKRRSSVPPVVTRALLADALYADASLQQPVKLQPPSGGADIVLFGAVHSEQGSPYVAEYILRNEPATVVVETSLDAAHGMETGISVRRADCLQRWSRDSDPRTLAFAQYGAELAGLNNPESSPLWNELCRYVVSEQLAYIAAFAVDANIVFGDRTKMTTYFRMLRCPSLADLDAAFGFQSLVNYAQMAPGLQKAVATRPLVDNCTERVFMLERDAILLDSLWRASLEVGQGGTVIGVVGASHIRSMQQLWKDNTWQRIIADHDAFSVPAPLFDESAEMMGVRRALFDGVIRLTCQPDVQYDINRNLEPLPPAAIEAYELTHELYGGSRMLLATLDRDALEHVCKGWNCDMWDVLAPLREARPVNGGMGYDRELVETLRTLNFEIG